MQPGWVIIKLMARQSTPLTELVMQLLERSHILTAPQILSELEKQGFKYNKTSLYRGLDKLLAEHLVCRQAFGGAELFYEVAGHHHDHFVCENCQLVKIVEHKQLGNLQLDASLQVDHYHLTYFGKCGEC
jgi:Fe2+ or Zn2+ uptake regulation protein